VKNRIQTETSGETKHETEIYFWRNGADHGNQVRRDLRQVLHGMPVISGEGRKVLSKLKHRGPAVVMRQGLPARSLRRRWEAKPRRASGAEKLGETARLNKNRGRAASSETKNRTAHLRAEKPRRGTGDAAASPRQSLARRACGGKSRHTKREIHCAEDTRRRETCCLRPAARNPVAEID
jgi:hypothetical protein